MSNQQPIYILQEGTQRTQGKTAQSRNISAALAAADTVRTTLGPKGMDKMLVDSLGDITITNDGVTILEEMAIEHPAAKMIVEVARTQENEVGDGTTTVVILAGELLKRAEFMLEKNIHPTVIVKGYRLAMDQSLQILKGIAEPVSLKEESKLLKIAMTAMTGKGAEVAKEKLALLVVSAVKQVMEGEGQAPVIDTGNIKIEKKIGSSIEESELIEGIILDKERVHAAMPRMLKDAKVLLLNTPIEIRNPETDAKIEISNPSQMQAFLEMEDAMLKKMVNKIISSGAKFVACQKGIDDLAQHYLAKNGILAVRRVKQSDITKLSKATGAKVVTKIDDLTERDLGVSGLVEERRVGSEQMTFVTECKKAKAVTLLIRGGTEHIVDEIGRAVEDAVGVVASAIRSGKVVAGAGSCEMEVARLLRKYANSLSGREQLAAAAFAEALEVIPTTLAENAGLDPIDVVAEIKSAHDKGRKWAGIDVFTGKMMDAFQKGVIEPVQVKTQALNSATEVAIMILRIDDVIAANAKQQGPME